MPRGQNFTKDQWSAMGKVGGRKSGQVRSDRIINKFMKLLPQLGVRNLIRYVREESWQDGYQARFKWEQRNGLLEGRARTSRKG